MNIERVKVRLVRCPQASRRANHHSDMCAICGGTSRVLKLFTPTGESLYMSTPTGKVLHHKAEHIYIPLPGLTHRLGRTSDIGLVSDYAFLNNGYIEGDHLMLRAAGDFRLPFKVHLRSLFNQRALHEWGMIEPILGEDSTWPVMVSRLGFPNLFTEMGVTFPIRPNQIISYSPDAYIITYHWTYYQDGKTYLDLNRPLDPTVALNLMGLSNPISLRTLHKK